jgi:hypothetical protein
MQGRINGPPQKDFSHSASVQPGIRIFTAYQLLPICCVASENYATIDNYLETELRYMNARGMRLKSAKAGP